MDFSTLQPGQLTIGASDFDARPMTYVESGQRLGYEPDVARAVCAQLEDRKSTRLNSSHRCISYAVFCLKKKKTKKQKKQSYV